MNLDSLEITETLNIANPLEAPKGTIKLSELPLGKYAISIKHEHGIYVNQPIKSEDILGEIEKFNKNKITGVFYQKYKPNHVWVGGKN